MIETIGAIAGIIAIATAIHRDLKTAQSHRKAAFRVLDVLSVEEFLVIIHRIALDVYLEKS